MLALLAGCAVFLLIMAGLLVPLEHFFPARPQPVQPRALAWGAGLFIANTVLMELLGAPLLDVLPSLPGTRTVAAALGVFVLADFVGYWVHRAMHRVPWLWRFHQLHHQATELTWLDAWRQHPIDFVVHGIAVGVPGALLGASVFGLSSVVVLRKAFTTFLHTNVAVDFGFVLASPRFHSVHHGKEARFHDTNFAGTFPVWDVLFGTASR